MIKKIHFILISSVLIVLVLNGCSFMLNEKFDTEVIHTRDVFKKLSITFDYLTHNLL